LSSEFAPGEGIDSHKAAKLCDHFPLALLSTSMTKPHLFKPFGDLPIFFIPFDAERFCDSAFAAAHIVCPEHIARSVLKRRAEFFHGRLCAQMALAEHNIVRANVGIGARREPIWPARMMGSISHTRTLAAAVTVLAEHRRGIGIDLELASEGNIVGAMGDIVVRDAELACLRSARGAFDLHQLLVVVFSAKESFFKATYNVVREYFDFDAVEVVAIDMEVGSIKLVVRKNLCALLRAGDVHEARFAMLDNGHVLTMMSW